MRTLRHGENPTMRVAQSTVGFLLLSAAAALASEPCTEHCAIAVDHPDREYARAATARVVVRNLTSKRQRVSVMLDALVDGEWRETPLSPSSPDHPFKIVQLSTIEPGSELAASGSLLLTFPACAALKIIPHGGGGRDVLVPCSESTPPMSSQYRLHVFVFSPSGSLVEEVVSSPYRVLPQ
jgi:hypothetical protein